MYSVCISYKILVFYEDIYMKHTEALKFIAY